MFCVNYVLYFGQDPSDVDLPKTAEDAHAPPKVRRSTRKAARKYTVNLVCSCNNRPPETALDAPPKGERPTRKADGSILCALGKILVDVDLPKTAVDAPPKKTRKDAHAPPKGARGRPTRKAAGKYEVIQPAS